MSDPTAHTTKNMDDIVALCRRRGFIWQSSEIYGGINGFWDYGPLGAELKRNLKNAWWADLVHGDMIGPDGHPIDIVPVDCTIIMHPKVWEASGHVAGFNDPMVDCTETKKRFRADHFWGLWRYELPEEMLTAHEDHPSAVGETAVLLDKEAIEGNPPIATAVGGTPAEAVREFMSSGPKDFRKSEFIGASGGYSSTVGVVSYAFAKTHRGLERWIYSPIPVDRIIREHDQIPSPFTGKSRSLTPPQQFNLMFSTYVGATATDDDKAYLRPETAQGIFTQFWNVVDTSRVKVPFGIAQQGKAFRNEVTPRNFTFRSREFEQMEIEFFIRPEAASEWYAWWRDSRFAWWQSVGLAGDNLILREHDRDELAHYAKDGAGTSDVEYRFPFTAPGYGELEGVAHRTDFDLRQHAKMAGKEEKMGYFDQERNERYFPHVIEPSAGADRGTLALICEAFTPTPERSGSKYVMKFTPRMAPIKAAVFPLVNKDGMPEVAEKLYRELRRKHTVQMDVKQSIGKRYARMDEAGTPFCFTIDGQTLSDQTVTVRDRDTAEQTRIALDRVPAFLDEKIGG